MGEPGRGPRPSSGPRTIRPQADLLNSRDGWIADIDAGLMGPPRFRRVVALALLQSARNVLLTRLDGEGIRVGNGVSLGE